MKVYMGSYGWEDSDPICAVVGTDAEEVERALERAMVDELIDYVNTTDVARCMECDQYGDDVRNDNGQLIGVYCPRCERMLISVDELWCTGVYEEELDDVREWLNMTDEHVRELETDGIVYV